MRIRSLTGSRSKCLSQFGARPPWLEQGPRPLWFVPWPATCLQRVPSLLIREQRGESISSAIRTRNHTSIALLGAVETSQRGALCLLRLLPSTHVRHGLVVVGLRCL